VPLSSAILGEEASFASVKKSFIWACLLSWVLNPEAEGLLRKESPPNGLHLGAGGGLAPVESHC